MVDESQSLQKRGDFKMYLNVIKSCSVKKVNQTKKVIRCLLAVCAFRPLKTNGVSLWRGQLTVSVNFAILHKNIQNFKDNKH